MPYDLPVKAIDYLLYNYRDLRREVENLGTRTSGLITIPSRGVSHGSLVERLAIDRAEITMVLDAVKRGWDALTPELRKLARRKYRWGWTYKEQVTQSDLSEGVVDKNLKVVRAVVAGYLALVPQGIFSVFWLRIRGT